MLTKNSFTPNFLKCLFSIKKNVPINKMIVVDAYSTDETIQTICKIFPNSIIIKSKQPLAQARKLGITRVTTNWFAFVDSDVQLLENWFKIISKFISANVGSIQGKDQYTNESLIKYSNWQEKIWKKKLLKKKNTAFSAIDSKNFHKNKVRGLTHNTLIRTSCVKDWDPPSGLHIGEDHHLFLHVLRKGYGWVVPNKILCLHYAFLGYSEIIRRGISETRELNRILKCGYLNKNELWTDFTALNYIKMFFLSCFKSSLASIYAREPRILLNNLCLYGSMLIGYFT